jgi:HEAT repeat protein
VGDDLDELRAGAARALAQSPLGLALDVLTELARDPTWFVRLRAIVSLGKLSDRRAMPPLRRGLTDSNRLVRLRAAEALIALKTEMVPIFRQVVAAGDRYGLHAYLTAVENANVLARLEEELRNSASLATEEKARLQNVLRSSSIIAEDFASAPDFTKVAAQP